MENTLKSYYRANAMVRLFMAIISATVTLEPYKGVSSETLSLLMLVAVFIDGSTNSAMIKWYEDNRKYVGAFLLADVVLCIGIAFLSMITTPMVYLIATMTVWSVMGVVMSTIWEDIKERKGDGRTMESNNRKYSANGRIIGLVIAMVLGHFDLAPDFTMCMVILALSTWFENYYLWKLSKES